MKPKATGKLSSAKASATASGGGSEVAEWEIRPGGMLVQKRNLDPTQTSIPIPTIKVRVKYESSYHEVNISPQANFGELKKMVGSRTGLHPNDQKLMYKGKERDSRSYLDVVGVKDGSKIVVIEDVVSRERRLLELQRNAKMDEVSKAISQVGIEVDKLAKQVAALESEIFGGRKVVERELLNLIELLMTQLIKLDGIVVDGDVKLKRKMQVRRVQKYIETLDMLKIRNSMIGSNGVEVPLQQQQKKSTGQMQKQRNSTVQILPPVVVTTKWETFDSGSA
ncbi:BAG family molecular chaperone regulator 1-like [Cornus florida]|uniref:BAG family molecular chaperone regulator 1-like n=1 Tax=Cornus florida TaxID=4283 RepID=UPI0028A0AE45|nr:BAG family molecular chaperone regulator 1-like [Cornus florida]